MHLNSLLYINQVGSMKLGLDNCSDLLEKLRYEKSKLDKEWNAYDFFNFTVTAWHLQNDWLKNDKEGRPNHAMRKVNQAPEQMKEVVNIARDIANGSKHFKLDKRNMEKKVIEELHEPEIRDWHSYFFGAKHGISTKTAYYSTLDFVSLIHNYLEWVLSDNLSESEFPEEIEKHLKFCKLENV